VLLGVDIGTGHLKVVAYAPHQGTTVAVTRRPTRTHRPRPGWAEFEADEIWSETAAAIREVVNTVGPETIEGIAIGSMGESGVLLDEHLQPLAPMIAWYDRRTDEQATWWRTVVDPWSIYQITGLVLDAKFSANQVLWLREHHPARFAAARHWLCVPDFLVWKLSGEQITDYSIASRTMLFDQRHLAWSNTLLEQADLPRALLPPVVPGGTRVGTVTPAAAAETGLPPRTVVVTGGHDHLVGALGAGVLRPGSVLDSSGTAAVLLQLTDVFAPHRALFDAGLETYCFVRPETYVIMGSINLVGGAVDWLARLLWGDDPAASALALEAAEAAPPGSGGSMWLPHLLGSGTPHADGASRAALVGLRPEHDRGHLVRGLLEGLAYWLRENLEVAIQHAGLPPDGDIVAIGGATRSPFWTQLKADVCGRSFRVPQIEESVALGAALLAGIGAGVFADAQQAVASVRAERHAFLPDPEAGRLYEQWYGQVYRRLYPALREIHATIDSLSPRAR
jgi:xylulokinase